MAAADSSTDSVVVASGIGRLAAGTPSTAIAGGWLKIKLDRSLRRNGANDAFGDEGCRALMTGLGSLAVRHLMISSLLVEFSHCSSPVD